MTTLAPERLAIELRELRRKYPDPTVWAFYHPAPWTGPAELQVDGKTWRVRVGATPLAVCEAVAEAGGHGVVLLSAVDETALPSDVVARLGRQRLQRPDAWMTLMAAFKADRMAPWLRAEHALAEALLAVAPEAGFAAAPGGVLEPDLAWDELFRYRFELPDGRPDAVTWLAIAVDSTRASRFHGLPDALQKAVVNRAMQTGGPLGADLARAVIAGTGMAVVAGGLLAEIVYGEERDHRDVVTAAVRLEDKLGLGPKLPVARGLDWFQAACNVEGTLDAHSKAVVRELAGRWLDELGLAEHAAGSSVLEAGLTARLAVLAKALEDASKPKGKATNLEAAWQAVERHALAVSDHRRSECWQMAVRLTRWLRTPAPATAQDLAEAARRHGAEGGWIDRALRIVGEG
ncbi:MAG TPA: BREX-2 system phosphatase PglZ, partial [Oscillatoriaceae cyanobacterium]